MIKLISKIALPIAIIYFGWVQYHTSFEFERNKSEKELMLKFIEISWNSLNSNDTSEIKNAVRLLSTVNPEYSQHLLNVLLADTIKYGFLDKEISEAILAPAAQDLRSIDISISCEVGESQQIANEIRDRLIHEANLKEVQVSVRVMKRLKDVSCSNAIFYSNKTDLNRVKALQTYLNTHLNSNAYFILEQNKRMNKNELHIRVC